MSRLEQALKGVPVIAAVRDLGVLDTALRSPVSILFIMGGEICDLRSLVDLAARNGKFPCVHIDLVEGLSGDRAGLRFLAEDVRARGIITTRGYLVPPAQKLGLLAIQRVFALDSQGLETGLENAINAKPDAVEIMPGVIPRVIRHAVQRFRGPVIAGGLISSVGDARNAFKAGATVISTTRRELWDLRSRYEINEGL